MNGLSKIFRNGLFFIDGVLVTSIMSEIVAFGVRSDFHGCAKNRKLFEESATSFYDSASMKIAPRKTLKTNKRRYQYTFLFQSVGKRSQFMIPILASRNLRAVARQPKPYSTLLWKLMKDASGA